MGLIRLIILGIVIYLVWQLIRRWQNKPANRVAQTERKRIDGSMVRCDHCGLFIPKEEAIQANGRQYCSEAHRLADGKDQ
ncbi:PP0621 family protein [Thiohalobacter thiocyanaticus]|uniref:MYND finger n=1 Tax=Thiohalobacter thiocyanaticus TaxID=585455 RepID=A0A426QL84_9GAMM|nr:PP0621 family protein [Thiohalobacter thiocyanaticus]RRQ22534.1 hypothetical protein D6C00_11700 [Thiohalobacter thiocyanaticus]